MYICRKNNVKLLYLIKSLAAKAGTERVMSDKMNWLASRGYEIILVTYEQGTHPFAFKLDGAIKHYDLDTRFFQLSRLPLVKKCIIAFNKRRHFEDRLLTVINNEKPDLLIATTYSGLLLGSVLKVCSNIPKLLESHAICENHWKSKEYGNEGMISYLWKLYDIFFLKSIRAFDELVTLTSADANDWSQYVRNIKVIPNPISYIPKSICNNCNSNRIICVGRLEKEKGFDLLVEAFSIIALECPNWHVDIYGEGGEEVFLRKMIAYKKLSDRILIHKPVDHIFDEYLNSDIFVLSSRNEGFGLVLLEAMVCGLPCVSFNCPYGPGEIVTDGYNGILVKNGDVIDMADKILWMIDHPEERLNIGKMARKSIKRFCEDAVMQEWVSLFDSLL